MMTLCIESVSSADAPPLSGGSQRRRRRRGRQRSRTPNQAAVNNNNNNEEGMHKRVRVYGNHSFFRFCKCQFFTNYCEALIMV